jgi:hypothetical protein
MRKAELYKLKKTSCNKKLVDDLKELREHANLLRNMFVALERYRITAGKANEKLNALLYELTGDKLYVEQSIMTGEE